MLVCCFIVNAPTIEEELRRVLVSSPFLLLLVVGRVSVFQRKRSRITQSGGWGQICLGFTKMMLGGVPQFP